ncbi:MAG TPA: DUF1674 domain-containing protein [Hellea balneolensis]|uniref:DUF1674 domain-containing protein n=1 Tax=Hellea balneolensis TaxID=287478 RepID=A0A7V5NW76_9PROT|nr:DUF1674 domain-containing protein [Hellea balneolensis]
MHNPPKATQNKKLSKAAQRALKEAEARRAQSESKSLPKEYGGSRRAEPTRYGDWERGGIASDF